MLAVNDIVRVAEERGDWRNDFVERHAGTFWRIEWISNPAVIAGKLDSSEWSGFVINDLVGVDRADVPPGLLDGEVLSLPHFKTDALNRAAGLLRGGNDEDALYRAQQRDVEFVAQS